MRVSPEFLDRLRMQITLSQVVGKSVPLKRKGREWWGCCPYHNEKTASFSVNDDKAFYHCFGCGAHGDAISFLMDQEGLAYMEAVERLAASVGMSLPRLSEKEQKKYEAMSQMHDVMEMACAFFEEQLPKSREAMDYLASRELTAATRKAFRIGFAPDMQHGLKQHLLAKGVEEKMLVELGLIILHENRASYDRFRARLMFPILDRRGKVIAFGGRVIPALLPAGMEAPKYLNSPETPLFHKGEVLYAFMQARKEAHKRNRVVVTEGYMDVIALHQAGVTDAVAPLGTAVTEQHLQLLWQMADEPVMCLDGDNAGQRAMKRVAELSLPLLVPGKGLRFATLPQGEDPDSLVRGQGAERFESVIGASISLSSALWEMKVQEIPPATPEKRAHLEHELMQMAEQVKDATLRQHLAQFFKDKLWKLREKPPVAGGEKAAPARAVENTSALRQFMSDAERVGLVRREMGVMEVLWQYPSLIGRAEVEARLAELVFQDEALEQCRKALMDFYMAEGGEGDWKAFLRGRKLKVPAPLAALPEKDGVEASAGEMKWQLMTLEWQIEAVDAEAKALERQLSHSLDMETYERLVQLKQHKSELQQRLARLQANAEN